ncbi:MAG: HAD family hydrolase [Catenulispora sp.]
MRYRAVLFDLDDTLIPEEPAIVAGFTAVAQAVWGSSSAERVQALWAAARQVLGEQAPSHAYMAAVHIGPTDLLHGSVVGGSSQADALRAFLPYYLEHAFDPVLPESARPMARQLAELWREARLAALTVYPDTVGVLDRLSGEVPLALVTNGLSKLQRDKVEVTGLARFFTTVVVAEEVGAGKPLAPMFNETLRRLGLDAGDAVMVGNDFERDIAGSRAVGLAAIQINRGAWAGARRVGPVRRRDGAGAPDTIANLCQLVLRLGAS